MGAVEDDELRDELLDLIEQRSSGELRDELRGYYETDIDLFYVYVIVKKRALDLPPHLLHFAKRMMIVHTS